MKPRARRVTLAAAVFGIGVLAVLVVVHWGAVCDHARLWHFQLTRETKTLEPDAEEDTGPMALVLLAYFTGHPVIFDPAVVPDARGWLKGEHEPPAADLLRDLSNRGFRVLEQRFPRRAYVVIRDQMAEPVVSETLLVPFVNPAE